MSDFYKLLDERCGYSSKADRAAVKAECELFGDLESEGCTDDYRRSRALSRAMSTRSYNAVKIYHEALMSYMLEKGFELPSLDSLISLHFDK